MNEQDKHYRIARAQDVLRDIHHIPVATVNRDGSPHDSPVFLVFDMELHGFWASSPTSLHSQNIARDHRVFLSVFDSREGHSGLFLAGTATELLDPAEIAQGLKLLTGLKQRLYGSMGDTSDYMETGSQRIYEFVPEHAWINHSEKRGKVIIRDQRFEIAIDDLISNRGNIE